MSNSRLLEMFSTPQKQDDPHERSIIFSSSRGDDAFFSLVLREPFQRGGRGFFSLHSVKLPLMAVMEAVAQSIAVTPDSAVSELFITTRSQSDAA